MKKTPLADLTSNLRIKSGAAYTSPNSDAFSFIWLFGLWEPPSIQVAEPRIVGRIEDLYDRGEIVHGCSL